MPTETTTNTAPVANLTETENRPLDMEDKKGRSIGALIEVRPAGEYHEGLGFPVAARVQPTRGGQGFGSYQSAQYFHTRDEAHAWAEARVARMVKAYARKVAAGKV